MSGSGHSSGGGPSAASNDVDCSQLTDETTLNSPDPNVIRELSVGDVLVIVLANERQSLVAMDSHGNIAGSITSNLMLQFIKCLDGGFEYVAVVQSIVGGQCTVQIRAGSR